MRIPHVVLLITTSVVFPAGCDTKATRPPASTAPALAPEPALTAETRIENPVYTRWAKFPVGTTVQLHEAMESAGKATGSATVEYTVTERGEGFVVVETQRKSQHLDGTPPNEHKQPLKHFQWMVRSKESAKDPLAPAGTYEHGTANIMIRGKMYATKWYKYKGRVEAGETLSQVWYCDEIPGAMVKLDFAVPSTQTKILTELVEVQTPAMK